MNLNTKHLKLLNDELVHTTILYALTDIAANLERLSKLGKLVFYGEEPSKEQGGVQALLIDPKLVERAQQAIGMSQQGCKAWAERITKYPQMFQHILNLMLIANNLMYVLSYLHVPEPIVEDYRVSLSLLRKYQAQIEELINLDVDCGSKN